MFFPPPGSYTGSSAYVCSLWWVKILPQLFPSNFGISPLQCTEALSTPTCTHTLCHFNFSTCSQFLLLCAFCTVPSGQVDIKHSQLCKKNPPKNAYIWSATSWNENIYIKATKLWYFIMFLTATQKRKGHPLCWHWWLDILHLAAFM